MSSTALKNFWLKIVAKLSKLLPRRHEIQEEESEPAYVPTELEKKLVEEIQRKQARGRAAAVSRGPNMPRYQHCWCGRPAKRTEKAQMGAKVGAFYRCPIHGEFFVGR